VAEVPLANAGIVHFGFEAGRDAPVYKFYMERRIPLAETQHAAAAGRAVPQHLALKWQPGGRCVTGTYLWFPGLSPAATIARLGQVFDAADPRPRHLAEAALGLAVPVLPPAQMQYLEVRDDGTPRRSFDFKYYGSGLLVRDALHLLNALRDHFGVPMPAYQAMLDQARDLTLGHIAGGLHRDGAPFFTLYAGPSPDRR
jgi:tryptophan halogenase